MKIFISFILLVLSHQVFAANWYVRPGTNGNGTSWATAFSSPDNINWTPVNPGDTIYVAGGTYGEMSMEKSGTAGNVITLRRATVGAHGSDTGWNPAWDAQVQIVGGGSSNLSALGIGQWGQNLISYVTVDGVVPNGIKASNAQYVLRAAYGTNHVTLRYLEIQSQGTGAFEDCIQGRGDNLILEYSYIHDCDNNANHGDGMQWFQGANVIVRYNLFENTGQVMMLTETAFVQGDEFLNDLNVYYNVFRNRQTVGDHNNGISKKLCPQAGHYWHVYNNTWDLEAQANDGSDNLFSGAGSCAEMEFKNNAVIYSNASSLSPITHSFNAYDNSGTYSVFNIPTETGRVVAADLGFVNPEAKNYNLQSGSPLIDAGSSVGLTQDFNGNPIVGNPDIGAFEFTSGGGDTTPPTVSSTVPTTGATGVVSSANITATFSEALNAATVTTTTASIKRTSDNAPVTSTVSYASNTITINPSADLTAGIQYTGTLTPGIQDVAGNALVTTYSWNFTIAASGTFTPPTGRVNAYNFEPGFFLTDSQGTADGVTTASYTPVTNAGKVGESAYFDGTKMFTATLNPSNFTGAYSFSFFINPDTETLINTRLSATEILKNLSATLFGRGIFEATQQQNISTNYSQAVVFDNTKGPYRTTIVAGQWNHVAITYSSNVRSLYVNGNLVATSKRTKPMVSQFTKLRLGATGFGKMIKAKIDSFYIFNRALNQADVNNLNTQAFN
jgi:hypothetical protein